MDLHFLLKELASATGNLAHTGIGAFLGAAAAFILENLRRKRDEDGRRYQELLSAQSVLLVQLNTVANILHGASTSNPDDENPFDNLKTFVQVPVDAHVNLERIAFLAEGDDPQLLLDLALADQAFYHVQNCLQLRNSLIEEFFKDQQTQIGEYDSASGTGRWTGDPVKIHSIKQASARTYSDANKAMTSIETAFRVLAGLIKRHFPKRKVLSIKEARWRKGSPSETLSTPGGEDDHAPFIV